MKHRLFAALTLFFVVSQVAVAQEEVSVEQVVALALEKNYDVLVVKKNLEASETNNNYAWGAFLPRVSGTASTLWTNNDAEIRVRQNVRRTDGTQVDSIVTRTGPTASNNVSASVQAVWTLFDGTRMFATRERIAVLVEQGQLALKDQMANTIAGVVTNYYDIVRQKQQLKAIQEQMSVSEERVKLAERKLQVGTGIKPELLQARVDFNAQRTQVLQQESIITQLKQQLNALVGLQLPAVYEVADTIVIDLNLDPETIAPNIENTNFALQAARQNLRIANLSLRERKAEYLPFLDFSGAYTYSKTDNTKLLNPFGTLYSLQNGYNYGFTLTLPILNGFNTRRLNQQAKIEVGRQTLLYNQLKTNVEVGLTNTYVNYDNAKKILLIEEETIGLAKENVFIALEGFKRSVTTFIELRTAQQSLADAYNRLITARYNAKVAETELLRLSGKLLR